MGEKTGYLRRSKERLARRRSELVEAFRRDLESKADRIAVAKELLGDDLDEGSGELTRRLAEHSELGLTLRRLAAEIDEIDQRIAAIDVQLRSPATD